VAGPVALATPRGVWRIDVQSAQQMHDAVLPLAASHDIFVATAAVADWRPEQAVGQKIKKGTGRAAPALGLTENPDILAAVAALPKPPFCVGFAAETSDLARHARDKLQRKKLALVVANIGPATFAQDDNALLLVDAQGELELPGAGQRAHKLVLARQLVAEIARRLGA
jgi:phosphopantothenoylcysteine decarboxylase/phosphopantothenate--cysteine ligase